MTAAATPSANAAVAPTRNSPAFGSERNSMSWTPCLSSSKAATPRLSSARPYWVGSTPCALRSRSRTPIVCSSSAIDLEIAGCVVFRTAAALLMLPACTTAIRTWRSCSFIRRPMRSLNCIPDPIAVPIWLYQGIALCTYSCIHYFPAEAREIARTKNFARAALGGPS